MIRVTLSDGKTYQLSFKHFYFPIPVALDETTFTTIFQNIPLEGEARLTNPEEPEFSLVETYRVHPSDNPDKAVGRRLALTKLTDRLENKNDSRAIWEAYKASGARIR